jgi:hypothetical protein
MREGVAIALKEEEDPTEESPPIMAEAVEYLINNLTTKMKIGISQATQTVTTRICGSLNRFIRMAISMPIQEDRTTMFKENMANKWTGWCKAIITHILKLNIGWRLYLKMLCSLLRQ